MPEGSTKRGRARRAPDSGAGGPGRSGRPPAGGDEAVRQALAGLRREILARFPAAREEASGRDLMELFEELRVRLGTLGNARVVRRDR